jgi:Cu/Ag efflux protein CusF
MGPLIAGCGIALMAVAGPAVAQPAGHADHGAPRAAGAASAQGAAASSQGEVRKVDKAAGKITLKHGEIRNLDMPPMTMVFQVSDPAMLDRVKTGDKVKFVAEKQGAALVVVAIEPAK